MTTNLSNTLNHLNNKQFTSLHLTSDAGTDLVISLEDNHTWQLTDTNQLHIAPCQDGITGTFVALPVTYIGKQIQNPRLHFADGQAIEYSAKTNDVALYDLMEQESFVSALYLSEGKVSLQLGETFVAVDCVVRGMDVNGNRENII